MHTTTRKTVYSFSIFQGAMAGLLCGLIFTFVIGFGGPKPPVENLPTYTNSCTVNHTMISIRNSLDDNA